MCSSLPSLLAAVLILAGWNVGQRESSPPPTHPQPNQPVLTSLSRPLLKPRPLQLSPPLSSFRPAPLTMTPLLHALALSYFPKSPVLSLIISFSIMLSPLGRPLCQAPPTPTPSQCKRLAVLCLCVQKSTHMPLKHYSWFAKSTFFSHAAASRWDAAVFTFVI